MSADQDSFGPDGSKSRARRLSATGRWWFESVVRTNRRGAFARIPYSRISRATVFSEHGVAAGVQLGGHPRAAVPAADLGMDLGDRASQLGAPGGRRTVVPAGPR